MNLFRSEEHARRWTGFSDERVGGLLRLAQLSAIMSTPLMRERLNGHYVSSAADYRREFLDRIREVTGAHPFWAPPVRPA